MNTFFDNLARQVARGTSRRDALRQFGASLFGLAIWSLRIRTGLAAALSPTCGTCELCDLDTNTCGLQCSSATAAQTLCTQVNQDGSYLRLVNHLTTNGFAPTGASDVVQFNQSGQLYASSLGTSFANGTSSAESAIVVYTTDANGNVAAFAFVLLSGVAIYGLRVDYSGRVIQTVFTQRTSFATASSFVPRGIASHAVTSSVTPEWEKPCNVVAGKLCGIVNEKVIDCLELGTELCGAFNLEDAEFGFIPCEAVVALLCKMGSEALCKAEADALCGSNCPPNTQACNDPNYSSGCCPACMDCQNGSLCVPNNTCANSNMGPCCGNQCCSQGYTCDTTTTPPTCKSPNSTCVGATCATFVPCSANTDCVCVTVAQGGGLCVPGSTPCAGLALCSSSADCPAGALCALGTCCGDSVCVPVALTCTDVTAAAVTRRVPAPTGPTIGHR